MTLQEKKTTMGGSTLKFDMAAMVYPKLVYWPTTSFVDVWKRRVTTKPL
jgi:hypothetical protein